jgi:uncharacterized protein YjiS (DUF1127 family)
MMTLTLIAATMRRIASWPVVAVKFARDRQALAHLARLDDRLLRDIGLERSDVYDAMGLPFGVDAGAFLQDRRGGRRPARTSTVASQFADVGIRLSAPANQTETARLAA